MSGLLAAAGIVAGAAAIIVGSELFAEHLSAAAAALGVTTFALALLVAGAEPEELATSVTASLRHSPGIALGDVIGANMTGLLVAVGAGAVLAPLAFDRRLRRHAALALPLGCIAAAMAWGGRIGRAEGALLVVLYAAYVAYIWSVERRPPLVEESGESEESGETDHSGHHFLLVLTGIAAVIVGALVLVEAVRHLAHLERNQTVLGLTVVGFATGVELVALAWSSSRRGLRDAVLAAVLGSFVYNSTMTLGAAGLVRPLHLRDASSLHLPLVLMLVALVAVIVLGRRDELRRWAGVSLLAGYGAFVAAVVVFVSAPR